MTPIDESDRITITGLDEHIGGIKLKNADFMTLCVLFVGLSQCPEMQSQLMAYIKNNRQDDILKAKKEILRLAEE